MTVVTMTREMGSLGKDVAAGVADTMGLEVIHHELVEHDVSDRLNMGESEVHRFLEGKPSLLERWKIDKKKLSLYTREEIIDLAAKDNVVIRGWGATSLLQNVPHVVRVRICAPMEFRIRVMQDRLQLNKQSAREEIERNDAAHSRVLRELKLGEWENALNYDLVLNTERIPVADCVHHVLSLAKNAAFETTPQSNQILSDMAIRSKVRLLVDKHPEITATMGDENIVVEGGNVVLSGLVDSKENANILCNEINRLPNVRSVTNNLAVLPASYAT